jgi:hypothetical protein
LDGHEEDKDLEEDLEEDHQEEEDHPEEGGHQEGPRSPCLKHCNQEDIMEIN